MRIKKLPQTKNNIHSNFINRCYLMCCSELRGKLSVSNAAHMFCCATGLTEDFNPVISRQC
jgi:hypothetical protein